MARKQIIADALAPEVRLRAEALALAIAAGPNRYPMIGDYIRDAGPIEAWLREALPKPHGVDESDDGYSDEYRGAYDPDDARTFHARPA